MQINATDKLMVTLEAQQWNQVLALLMEGPYRVSHPIIQAIHGQLLPTPEKPSNIVPMEAS
jgi:hypothetical protein